MAKAKKTSSKTAKKSSNNATRPAAEPSPLIDAAAVDAARLLANRARLHAAPGAPAPAAEQQKKESASFKQLKESIHHPAANAVSAAMGNAFGQQRSNLPLHGGNQVAHNQTIGSNLSRINVPRRTNG